MKRTRTRDASVCSAVIAAGLWASPALSGPTWPEGPEAGALPGSAQKVYGPGAIFLIVGDLSGPSPAPVADRGLTGDFQDMYLIKIVDPVSFLAATDPNFDGFADFDTQLFLFTGPDHPDGPGLGVFGNDDSPSAPGGQSLITNNVDDGSTPPPLVGGVHYYLAISGAGSDPVSAGGAIFNLALPNERSGPDGPGGGMPIQAWSGPGDFGSYGISLQGVEAQTFCPNSDINNDGITDTADLGLLIGDFGSAGGLADLNFDGVVDTADLGLLISTFGVECL